MKKLLLVILLNICILPAVKSPFGKAWLGCLAQDYRDVVYLKNGSVIKGFYKEMYANDSLRMETLDGSKIILPYDQIVRIAKEKTDVYVIKETEMMPERKWRPRGYQGFVEYSTGMYLDDSNLTYTTISTTHGYQFSRHLFLGLGISLSTYKYKYDKYILSPQNDSFGVHVNGRWYILHSRIAPFVDLRGGYFITGDKGFDTNEGAGVDFCISPRFGLFVTVNHEYFYATSHDNEITRRSQHYLNLRMGIHF